MSFLPEEAVQGGWRSVLAETFGAHVVFFRGLLVVTAALGIWSVVRFRKPEIALAWIGGIGLLTWLFTTLPLERPYGLQPGTTPAFEMAVAAAGSASPSVQKTWIPERGNPRPAWSLLWYLMTWGRPHWVHRVYGWMGPFLFILLLLVLYKALAGESPGRTWESLCCCFTALLASSIILDALQPYGIFFRGTFLVSPHRGLALLIILCSGVVLRRGGWWRDGVAGGLLAVVGWLDVLLFAFGFLSLLALDLLSWLCPGGSRARWTWRAALLALVLSLPQHLAVLRLDVLARGASREEVLAYRTAFRDVFSATSDMQWIFVLAILAVPVLWKRARPTDLGILAMIIGAYALWVIAAMTYPFRQFSDPDVVFHLLRFTMAVAAGVGGFRAGQWVLQYLGSWEAKVSGSGLVERLTKRICNLSAQPMAFVLVVVFLLPSSAPFLWHPLRMDGLYFPSLRPLDSSIERLGEWIVENTRQDEVIVTSTVTGELTSVLSGRAVLNGVRVVSRERTRYIRRRMRTLLLSEDREAMRTAQADLGASLFILDWSLRRDYPQMSPSRLVSSGLFRPVHQIGDDYLIYRTR